MCLKSCVSRNGDPCLIPRSLSQPEIFFSAILFSWDTLDWKDVKFITLVWSVLETFTFILWWGVFLDVSIVSYPNLIPGGGGGGTLIFSHIRRLGPFFWAVQSSEFQYFWGFSEKWIFFGGMKILWIFFGGHHKIGLVWGSFLCNLGSFLRPRYRNGIFFGVAKISNSFWGAWNS